MTVMAAVSGQGTSLRLKLNWNAATRLSHWRLTIRRIMMRIIQQSHRHCPAVQTTLAHWLLVAVATCFRVCHCHLLTRHALCDMGQTIVEHSFRFAECNCYDVGDAMNECTNGKMCFESFINTRQQNTRPLFRNYKIYFYSYTNSNLENLFSFCI